MAVDEGDVGVDAVQRLHRLKAAEATAHHDDLRALASGGHQPPSVATPAIAGSARGEDATSLEGSLTIVPSR